MNLFLNTRYIRQYLPVFLILVAAFFLRIYRLDQYPSQIHVDELSNIYDGYSVAETGTDRWGTTTPGIIRGYGDNDYRPPLYVWLSAVTIKLGGYSVFTGRLPSVIFGVLSLIILYATAKKIGGVMFAYVALILAALSPWHIVFSRIALESASLPSFFIILTIYLFIKVKETLFKLTNVAYLGCCIGFATNDYQSTKLIFFIIFLLVLIHFLAYADKKLKVMGIFILFAGIGALPQIHAAFSSPQHFFSRASNTMMPFHFSFQYFYKVFENFLTNLSPQYLFFSFGTYNNLTVCRLLNIEMSVFYLGCFSLYWNFKDSKYFNRLYFYLLVIICILPSALTFDNPHSLRTSCVVILYPLISSAGFMMVYNQVPRQKFKMLFAVLMGGLLVANFTSVANAYVKNFQLRAVGQQALLVQLGKKVNQYQHSFDRIYIEYFGNQPYMYITHYCEIKPQAFKETYIDNIGAGWDHVSQLDKFYFLESDTVVKKLALKKYRSLGVLKSKVNAYPLIDSISVNNKTLYFYKNY
jgi:4-amino-4-deoxy-L-arabinose transferase-like glycosyltransferase